MYVIFIIALLVLGIYGISTLNRGGILKSIFHPAKAGEEAAEEYSENMRRSTKC